jgi:uncharacterized protein YegL
MTQLKENKMAIITIEGEEYETNDFTEDQNFMLKEIQTCSQEANRAAYTHKLFDVRGRYMISKLADSLDQVDDSQEEMDV